MMTLRGGRWEVFDSKEVSGGREPILHLDAEFLAQVVEEVPKILDFAVGGGFSFDGGVLAPPAHSDRQHSNLVRRVDVVAGVVPHVHRLGGSQVQIAAGSLVNLWVGS